MRYYIENQLRLKKLPPQNDNFSKWVIWGTGYEFFIFRRKFMFRYQDIQVLVFLTIPRFTKSVTSW